MTSKLLPVLLIVTLLVACDSHEPTPVAEASPAVETDVSTAVEPKPLPSPAAAARAEPAPPPPDLPIFAVGPVAKIDGVFVDAAIFNAHVRRIHERQTIPSELFERFASNIVERCIQQHLAEREIRRENIGVSDAEIEREIAGMPDEQVRLLDEKTSWWRTELPFSLKLRKLLSKRYDTQVTPAEAREHFDANRGKFRHPAKVKASHILVKVARDADDATVAAARANAEKVAALAKRPDADFAALARKHSEGPTARRGGDLGYFEDGKMVPEFSNASFALAPGEVSGVVRTQFGFHIIKLIDRKEPYTDTFDDVRDGIVAELEVDKRGKAYERFLAEQRERSTITTYAHNIASASAKPFAPPENGQP